MEVQKPSRFYMLDTLRGVMIIGVVLFHFAFDLYLVGIPWAEALINASIFEFIANIGRFLFLFIAGICCFLSRNNLKRSLLVLAGAGIVSIATLLLDVFFGEIGDMLIYFGILHLMGVCMLIYALSELIFKKKLSAPSSRTSRTVCLAISLLLLFFFFALFNLGNGSIGIFGMKAEVHSKLYGTLGGAILGFPGFEPASADYFPLIPWAFAFFAGASLGVYFKEDRVPSFLHRDICPLITKIGQKTLYIYILHQPLIYGIAALIGYIAA